MEKSKTPVAKRKKKGTVADEGGYAAPAVPALLTIHLWADGGRTLPQGVFAMVGDLLSASRCEVRQGGPSSIAASFMDAGEAVEAARRARQLVRGFSEASKSGALGGCFLLSTLEEANADAELQLAERFPILGKGQSGQVLVIGGLCDPARSIPGLRFEAISEEWMAESNRHYRPVLALLPPAQMEGYVAEPARCWAPAVESGSQVAIAEEFVAPPVVVPIAPPVVADVDMPVLTQITTIAPPPAVVEREPEPVAPVPQEVVGFSRGERPEGQRSPMLWVAIGGALLVVLAVVGAVVAHTRKPVPLATQTAPVVADPGPAVTPTPQTEPASGTPPATPQPPAEQKPAETSAKGKLQPNAGEKHKGAGNLQAGNDGTGVTPSAKEGGDRVGSLRFTPAEIERTIDLADRESGDGRFDDAITNYRIVLKYDPKNVRAREGLDRALRNRPRE